jgi:hypothetical protein
MWCGTVRIQLTINQLGLAGALSGVFTTAIMVPGDRIKVILQVCGRPMELQPLGDHASALTDVHGAAQTQDAANKKYNGPLDVMRKVFQEAGVRGLYKVGWPCLCAHPPTHTSMRLTTRACRGLARAPMRRSYVTCRAATPTLPPTSTRSAPSHLVRDCCHHRCRRRLRGLGAHWRSDRTEHSGRQAEPADDALLRRHGGRV